MRSSNYFGLLTITVRQLPGREADVGHKALVGLFVPRCDAPELLDLRKAILDLVTPGTQVPIVQPPQAICERWNRSHRPTCIDLFDQPVRVERPVPD